MGTILPLLFAGFLLWKIGAFGGGTSNHEPLLPGKIAPPFQLPAHDQRLFQLADYKGRAVLLAFVPSWRDAETLAEVRSLATTISQFDAVGAKVMMVSGDSRANAQTLYRKEKLPFPLLMDRDNSLAKRYGVPGGMRTTFVVDPTGRIKISFANGTVDTARHGQQIWNASHCCLDEVIAARAHGIGEPVGDFSLPSPATGNMQTLFGAHEQAATVVLFLSAKCPCSNSYTERIKTMAESLSDKPVRIVGIYSNQDESPGEIAAHAKQSGFTFPVYRDDHALGADHFRASVTPEAYVLDHQNTLRYAGRIDDNRDANMAKAHDLRDAIGAVLAGQTPARSDTRAFGCGIIRN